MTSDPKMQAWPESIGLAQYATVVADNDVDLDVAPDLADDDLRELGLNLGHRKKDQKAITAIGGASKSCKRAFTSRASVIEPLFRRWSGT